MISIGAAITVLALVLLIVALFADAYHWKAYLAIEGAGTTILIVCLCGMLAGLVLVIIGLIRAL